MNKDNEETPTQSAPDSNISGAVIDDEMTFADLGLSDTLLNAVKQKGFSTPSPIQVLAIPRLLESDTNIIAKARTGTGKTAAFALPIIQKLLTSNSNGAVKALILEPTRELAIQTQNEFQSFIDGALNSPNSTAAEKDATTTRHNSAIKTCVIYGGSPYSDQIRSLKARPQIVVGTPGRVKDHIDKGLLRLDAIDYFILDEADEMLDLGFHDDIEEIFKSCNSAARILLFSATMSDPIKKIAQNFMGPYEVIEENKVTDEPLLITQKFWIMRRAEKLSALVRLIDYSDNFYGLVFVQTKSDADDICKALDLLGYSCAVLHGDIAQVQREKVLERFRIKKTRILVATDVAARGIDISGLTHVVNYSLPYDCETYVHRIGRTGRAGSSGVAITFVTTGETRKLSFLQRDIKRISRGVISQEVIPTIDEVIKKKSADLEYNLLRKLGNKPAKQFKRMADFLWRILDDDNDKKDILARVLSVMYEGTLSRDKYGEIEPYKDYKGQRTTFSNKGRRAFSGGNWHKGDSYGRRPFHRSNKSFHRDGDFPYGNDDRGTHPTRPPRQRDSGDSYSTKSRHYNKKFTGRRNTKVRSSSHSRNEPF